MSEPMISINAALKKISEQCGVYLTISDTKILGEQTIFLSARETDARRLLDYIAALFHYKSICAEWKYEVANNGYNLSIDTPDYHIPKSEINSTAGKLAIMDNWLLESDNSSNDKEKEVIRLNAKEDTIPFAESDRESAFRILSLVAQKYKLPVVALYPAHPQWGTEHYMGTSNFLNKRSINGLPLGDIFVTLSMYPFHFTHKWHDGVLLLRDPLTPYQEKNSAGQRIR